MHSKSPEHDGKPGVSVILGDDGRQRCDSRAPVSGTSGFDPIR